VASAGACGSTQPGADGGTGAPDAQVSDEKLLIGQVRTIGPAGDKFRDELVTIFNPSDKPVVFDDSWQLWHQTAQGACSADPQLRYVGTGQTIPAYGHLLLVGTQYMQTPTADDTFIGTSADFSLADAGSIWLLHGGKTVDAVCYYYDAQSQACLGVA